MKIKKKLIHLLGGITKDEIVHPEPKIIEDKTEVAYILGQVTLDYFTVNTLIRNKSKDKANRIIKKMLIEKMNLDPYIKIDHKDNNNNRTRTFTGSLRVVKKEHEYSKEDKQ